MKNIIIFLLILITNKILAQSISPTISTEYCPNENIEFTITITAFEVNTIEGIANLVAPLVILQPYNINSSEGVITFKFVGRFLDQNTRQTFKLNYKTNSTTSATHDFIFVKIKSLYTPTSYSQIIPSPSTFFAPLCEITTRSISFANVQYGNPFENPAIGYGTIIHYEYLLPAGWKLGSQTSDGTTWINGSNSENITSDFTTAAANGFIQIRPVNTACGSGLAKNHSTLYPISRPGPVLTMDGEGSLCFPNNYEFEVKGYPTNSSIVWPVNSYYTTVPSGYSAQVTPTSAANGTTNVKATITPPGCSLSFDVQKFVNIGLPYVTFNIDSYPLEEPNCFEVWAIYSFRATIASGQGSTGWQWGYRLVGSPGEVLDPYNINTFTFIPQQSGTYEIFVRPKNACGTGTTESMRTIVVYDVCGWGMKAGLPSIKVFPNPASSTINLTISSVQDSKTKSAEPVKIELYDLQAGRIVQQWNFEYLLQNYSLNIQQIKPGAYFLRLITKNGTTGSKVIIQ